MVVQGTGRRGSVPVAAQGAPRSYSQMRKLSDDMSAAWRQKYSAPKHEEMTEREIRRTLASHGITANDIPDLVEVVKDKPGLYGAFRGEAIRTLAALGATSQITLIVGILQNDQDWALHQEAIDALSTLQAHRAVIDTVIDKLTNSAYAQRTSIFNALASLPPAKKIDAIQALIAKKGLPGNLQAEALRWIETGSPTDVQQAVARARSSLGIK